MLDADEARITKSGFVTIDAHGETRVLVEGFEGDGCSCRDMAALAIVWAIGELQHELMALMERPGGGSVGID